MHFSKLLISWYKENKRDLPWRKTNNPYLIWLSEIILQQTRVEQGLTYFQKFSTHFPTIFDLAKADESKVLKLWQGLGYYSRARNLHFTAKFIVDNFEGEFPQDYTSILNLKGIGEYTAAAIATFSYQLPYAVVDGNVYRVLSRLYGISEPIDSTKGKKVFKDLAKEILNTKNPSIHNQAIMEFGALHCKPKNPKCETCIFRVNCNAYQNNLVHLLPIKSKKLKQKNRYFNYIVFLQEDNTFIEKRIKNDIWKGLYQFPLIETKQNIEHFENLKSKELPFNINSEQIIQKSSIYIHLLSHQKIHATFWKIKLSSSCFLEKKILKCSLKKINNYAVPKLIEKYIQNSI